MSKTKNPRKTAPQQQKRPPLKTRLKSKCLAAGKVFKNPRHDVALALTLAFVLISALCFQNSWLRIGEAFRDVGTSLAFGFTDTVTPTVTQFSSVTLQDLGLLPENFDVLLTKLKLFGLMLTDGTSYLYYASWLLQGVKILAYVLLSILPLTLVLVLVAWVSLKIANNDYNEDTKPLQIVKFIANHTYRPVKRALLDFKQFLKDHKIYIALWITVWALSLNFVTIILEIIAYYFYFVASFDFVNLYVQLYKLILDLSVIITFFPLWAWVIICAVGFDIFRRLYSKHKLIKLEEKCEETVAELPIAVLITGTMNTRKTTFLTELSITYNKYFRDVADKKMFEIAMRFPNFPWINLERCIKYCLDHHTIYNLATCKLFIQQVRSYFENPRGNSQTDERVTALRYKFLAKKYGYTFKNYIFDYDMERYGFTYYDNLEVKNIFDILETYAQLYFIYVISCSLMLANYSIRVDDFQKDKGNFPLWDIDFFRNDPEKVKKYTRRSHILDFEALRIGTRAVSNSKFADSIDFGIIVKTEEGKEEGNQKTQSLGYYTFERLDKNGKPVKVTPANSLINMDKKMARHRATVDNFPFVVFLGDEQRAASLNADAKELDDVLYIAKASDFKFNTPFFALDELVYMATYKLMHKFHNADRHAKGNNTLMRHTLRNAFAAFIFQRYERFYNMYTVSTLTFNVQDGNESEKGHKLKYRLSKKKVHSARFSTDAYAAYYFEKTKNSPVGIVDIPEYAGKLATREELNQTNGFFAHAMDMMFPKGE